MKTHANTLYVTTDNAYIARAGNALEVRREKKKLLSMPIHMLAGLVCFGRVSVTPPALAFCSENNVAVTFLSPRGRFLARVLGPTSGNVLLRRRQYRSSDDPSAALPIAANMVFAKIANARNVLLRAARDTKADARASKLRCVASAMTTQLDEVARASDTNQVRGTEGKAAMLYFGAFNNLITVEDADFRFAVRSRRPPQDNVNALLSLLYTLLLHDCRSACETVGLDPQVGFLHHDRPGRASLALDLMEELRAPFADRLALSMMNRRQIQKKHCVSDPAGGVTLTEEGRKRLLVAYQKRKQDALTHPFLGEKTTVGLVPFVQAQLLARHLRGDLDEYPSFFWK